jgi:hypothetical protein
MIIFGKQLRGINPTGILSYLQYFVNFTPPIGKLPAIL